MFVTVWSGLVFTLRVSTCVSFISVCVCERERFNFLAFNRKQLYFCCELRVHGLFLDLRSSCVSASEQNRELLVTVSSLTET